MSQRRAAAVGVQGRLHMVPGDAVRQHIKVAAGDASGGVGAVHGQAVDVAVHCCAGGSGTHPGCVGAGVVTVRKGGR